MLFFAAAMAREPPVDSELVVRSRVDPVFPADAEQDAAKCLVRVVVGQDGLSRSHFARGARNALEVSPAARAP